MKVLALPALATLLVAAAPSAPPAAPEGLRKVCEARGLELVISPGG